ncbi:hypothetical protein GCM10009415_39270 [Chitinophaga japonensis]
MSCGISYALLFSIVFAMASCSKDGDTGPEGPAGPAGPEGPAGEQGPKGDTGTANVIYSGWLDVTFGLNSDSTAFIAEIDAPKIDQEVLATGEVKVYMNLSNASDPFIVPLPYFDGTFLINVRMYEQTINLLSFNNLSTFTDENDGMKYQQARYVIIPGGTAARQAAGIDWNDYQQVKNYLGLKD